MTMRRMNWKRLAFIGRAIKKLIRRAEFAAMRKAYR